MFFLNFNKEGSDNSILLFDWVLRSFCLYRVFFQVSVKHVIVRIRHGYATSYQGCSLEGKWQALILTQEIESVLTLFVPLTDLFFSRLGDCQGKARRSVKSHPQAPIYEEMVGVKSTSRKLAPRHLEEMESSEYRNCPVKKSCPDNHYESPSGALCPRRESPK